MFSSHFQSPAGHPSTYDDTGLPHVAFKQNAFDPVRSFPGLQEPLGVIDTSRFRESAPSPADSLSNVLGELKINEAGIGMRFQPRSLLCDYAHP